MNVFNDGLKLLIFEYHIIKSSSRICNTDTSTGNKILKNILSLFLKCHTKIYSFFCIKKLAQIFNGNPNKPYNTEIGDEASSIFFVTF